MKKVTIIDYGVGNLFSAKESFEHIDCQVTISDDFKTIANADFLVLPGVGAFSKAIAKLKEKEIDHAISEYLKKERPFLGICLGMQLLLSESLEFGNSKGLDLISGKVIPIKNLNSEIPKIPHIGWNTLNKPSPSSNDSWDEQLFNHQSFYFCHSFVATPDDQDHILATTNYYGTELVASINKDHIFGTQFHPEKSHEDGLNLLKNFLK